VYLSALTASLTSATCRMNCQTVKRRGGRGGSPLGGCGRDSRPSSRSSRGDPSGGVRGEDEEGKTWPMKVKRLSPVLPSSASEN
jgi:hypothetical protein